MFGSYGVPVRYSRDERAWDLEALLEAATPDELHRALVLHPPAAVAREPMLPVTLLRQVHAVGAEAVAPTFVLLATDPRFSSVTGLTADLVDTGLVPDGVVDLVAEAFAAADESLWWACPEEWFDDEQSIEVVVAVGAEDQADITPEGEAGQAVVERTVTTDARRWAVNRIVRRNPHRWPALRRRASDASRRVAPGVWLGLLDAADAMAEEAASFVEQAALASGDATVRLAALRHLAARDPQRAVALAEHDPSARVRSRADRLAVPVTGEVGGGHGTRTGEAPDPDDSPQGTLFDI